MQKYIDLLKANKNLILTGAPGTGKTYLSKEIAKSMGAEPNDIVQFHPSYDYTDFVEGLRPIKKGEQIVFERKDGVFKQFCKNALKNLIDSKKSPEELKTEKRIENYLNDFIPYVQSVIEEKKEFTLSGISGKQCAPIVEIDYGFFTVTTKNNNSMICNLNGIIEKYMQFSKQERWTFPEFRNSIASYYQTYYYGFLNALKEFIAQKKKDEVFEVEKIEQKDFVFIIDEINRGETSRIFGELFYAIDPGYRGTNGKVKTQYQNLIEHGDEFFDGFYVPENVYILGTMNDIDRSVESMDFAIRRRFAWKEVTAEESAENMKLDEEIKARMKSLNDKILTIKGLNASYHIGASYFLKLQNKEKTVQELWENHLKGVLFEYVRGSRDAENNLKQLESAYFSIADAKPDENE